MPLLWTSLILKESSNVVESAVVNMSLLFSLSRARLIDLLQLISAKKSFLKVSQQKLKFEVSAILLHTPWPILLGLWLLKHLQY